MYILQLYTLQHENWNKINALVNVPKEETHHESDDLNRINSREFTCLPLFALLVTHEEKRQSRMPVSLKKAEFTPVGVQAGSPSCTFHPEVTGAGGKIQSKNYTGWNANSYINTRISNKCWYAVKHNQPTSVTIRSCWPSPFIGPLDCIQCLHKADECKSLLVSQNWYFYV